MSTLFVIGLVIFCVFYIIWLLCGCQYQRKRLPGKSHFRSDRCVSSGTLNSTQYSLTVCACLYSAFAELQIDMSEVANDILSSSGLPFRDCTNYSVRVLFASDKWQSYVVTEYVSCSLLELLGKGWLGVLFLQTAQMQSLHLINYILYLWLDSIMIKALVGWLSGRTSVSDRRTFTGLHRTCS